MKRICTALLLVFASGCATPVRVAAPEHELKSARTAATLAEIRRTGRNGDWLVIRGYHGTDDLVTIATNTPWSHAAVLDAGADQVIEADSKGVRVSPLAEFVARSHRLLLVRPSWADEKSSGEAVLKARALVGKGYDFLGLVGIDNPERFYCSELAVAVYRPYIPTAERIPRPVAPAQLHYWGRILYDSGNP
jgi:hypothetical protein